MCTEGQRLKQDCTESLTRVARFGSDFIFHRTRDQKYSWRILPREPDWICRTATKQQIQSGPVAAPLHPPQRRVYLADFFRESPSGTFAESVSPVHARTHLRFFTAHPCASRVLLPLS